MTTIYQGHHHDLEKSDVNIIIDVIRAFTVAHYAFIYGAKDILLVGTVEEAFQLRNEHPKFLLAGEVNGIAIEGFDLENSPYLLTNHNLQNKTLIQKTTNGVEATLHALDANHVFVTGFSNAKTTATYIRQHQLGQHINIIASHPTGDDDLACAQYMKSIIEGHESIDSEDVKARIQSSIVAAKFFDKTKPEFNENDISYCIKEPPSEFVMKVNQWHGIPKIERVNI
ncbi:2-phosphosulfolactate phosphatase [Bacillus alkalicellulosilyticus]|uniref:2-phosphosulfolactate phosphatase n=1 Tax=Alkalihalobacterium alkalicellulosilyticum TaxID=1912214 RepID=UPI0009976FA4|nr:2-phosphosulfolactate phosphatase [Bacillus alkalicellulosilyticus]